MKKQLITLLMAGLLVVGFGGSALAAEVSGDDTTTTPVTDNTRVTEAIPVAWTINIPATIEAGEAIPIKASNMVVGVGKSVKVNVKDATDKLAAGVLTLTNVDKKITTDLSIESKGGTKIGANGVVAEFDKIKNLGANDPEIVATVGGTIFTSEPLIGGAFAGDYTGTLTFDIAYGDTTTP